MRPINMDLKYKENDLSFVWPKNADWSDEKTVPLKGLCKVRVGDNFKWSKTQI